MIRFFDIIFSSCALFIFCPFLLVIIALLRFTGEGEIFYKQSRIGINGEKFSLLKFATMLRGSELMKGGTITMKNDPRVLPVGSFLRKTKINEVPQLLNVLIGNMSLIGPRPLTMKEFSYYDLHSQKIITSMKPGLSGMASIIFRDEESMFEKNENTNEFYRNKIAPYKAEIEIWFHKNYSLVNYFLLIMITIWAVIFKSTSIYRKVFKDLPPVPQNLSKYLS